jgi:hypothetical protein
MSWHRKEENQMRECFFEKQEREASDEKRCGDAKSEKKSKRVFTQPNSIVSIVKTAHFFLTFLCWNVTHSLNTHTHTPLTHPTLTIHSHSIHFLILLHNKYQTFVSLIDVKSLNPNNRGKWILVWVRFISCFCNSETTSNHWLILFDDVCIK